MNQELGVAQKAIKRIHKIARHLLRPICVWVNTNASNVYGPRFDLDDEKHHLPYGAQGAANLVDHVMPSEVGLRQLGADASLCVALSLGRRCASAEDMAFR